MYYFVPAMVYMMIFCVLRPKSASLTTGKALFWVYLVLRRIFYGFKSRWVILWLWSSWTPLLICNTHSRHYFSFILLSLHRLRTSLNEKICTIKIRRNNTQWCTRRLLQYRWCRRFWGCFSFLLFWVTNWWLFPCWYLPYRIQIFLPFWWPRNRWAHYQKFYKPWNKKKDTWAKFP